MALHRCATPGCTNQAAGRNIFCSACWAQIPENHREKIRSSEKGDHSLRANPSKEWMGVALKYTASRIKKAA